MTAPSDAPGRNAPFRTAALVAVLLAALALSCFRVTNLDIGGHMAVGRQILKTHAIPDTDFLSHTVAGSPYPVHQWLGGVILFAVKYTTGATGLILLRMAVVLLAAVLLLRNARREQAPVAVAAGIVLLLLVATRPRFFVRPMLATLVFLPLLQAIVAEVRRGRTRRLWPILPLMAVWGHVHSGVLFGVLFLAATLAGEGVKILWKRPVAPGDKTWPGSALDGWDYRRLAMFSAIGIALPFATMALVNPSGLKPLVLPLLFFRNMDFRAMISEYRPVDILVDWPFDLVAGALLLGFLIRPKRIDLTDLLIVGGFGILAYQAVRGILPFAAVSAPLLARTWGALAEDAFHRRGARARLANGTEALVIVLVIGAALLVSVRAARGWMFPFGFGKDPKHYPERALDFVESEGLRGNVFNTDLWASAMFWRWPGTEHPVFVDARLEVYPEEFWRDEYYRVLQAAPGWETVLDERKVDWALLRREGGQSDERIGDALWDDPGWGLVYWDDFAMVFVRRASASSRNREVLRTWEFTAFSPRHAGEVEDLRGAALARAANQLAGIVEWAPDSFLPSWCLAAAWTRLGHAEAARELFAELAERPSARANAAFAASRARAELVTGDRAAWAALLREAGGNPDAPGARFEAAALLSAAGEEAAAVAMYREVLAAAPANEDARNNLALLLARDPAGIPEAMELVEEAVRRAPKDGYFLASRAEIRWRAGDPTGARRDFLRALELIPDDDRAARAEIGGWLARVE